MIFGFGGGDQIFAQGGNDILQGGEGHDYLNGGAGHDTANYGDSPVGVRVDLATGHGFGGTAEGDQLVSIENLTGSLWNDALLGNSDDNVLSGGWGNDLLEGGVGTDVLDGGLGSDTASYSRSTAGVVVSLLWDSASGGDAQGDELNSIENLNGSKHNDGLFGDNSANVIQGAGGDDTILGFDGNDTLYGDGRGLPSGDDALYGGAGSDILFGGMGADILAGGADADTFVWQHTLESAGVVPNSIIDYAHTDVTLDFNWAEGDRIDLQSVDANKLVDGNQDFTFVGEYVAAGGFTAAGQTAYFNDGTDTYLIFNTDSVLLTAEGVGDFEFAIRLPGLQTPEASWFL